MFVHNTIRVYPWCMRQQLQKPSKRNRYTKTKSSLAIPTDKRGQTHQPSAPRNRHRRSVFKMEAARSNRKQQRDVVFYEKPVRPK